MSMAGYTKLFNSILASTIWRADDKVRIVWITLLAMADRHGVAEGSIPGLADMARVTIEDAERALAELSAPDKYSRTPDNEGRRIRKIDGGWLLLNHSLYRAKMSADERRIYNRTKQAEWRLRKKASTNVNDSQSPSMTVNDCNQMSAMSAHTEAEAEADTKERSTPKPPEGAPGDGVKVKSKYHPDASGILALLNSSTGSEFRQTNTNLTIISARLTETDVTRAGVELMIARMVKKWGGTPQAEYLRPSTLFGKEKFDGYYAAREQPIVDQQPPRNAGFRIDFQP